MSFNEVKTNEVSFCEAKIIRSNKQKYFSGSLLYLAAQNPANLFYPAPNNAALPSAPETSSTSIPRPARPMSAWPRRQSGRFPKSAARPCCGIRPPSPPDPPGYCARCRAPVKVSGARCRSAQLHQEVSWVEVSAQAVAILVF